MVEGHQCHRVAAAHRKMLLHKAFEAVSPNGRFASGAAAIHMRPLRRIEVHGKNLFYFFSHDPGVSKVQLLPSSSKQLVAGLAPPASPQHLPRLGNALEMSEDEEEKVEAAGGDGAGAGPSQADPAPPATPVPRPAAAAAQAVDPATPAKRRRTSTRGAAKSSAGAASAHQDTSVAACQPGSTGGSAPDGVDLPEDAVVVMRVHFGMSGAFRLSQLPGPETTATTRLALTHKQDGIVAHLSAMTVEHGGLDLYRSCAAKLGPDPLREDADAEVLWQSMCKSRKPVGLVLMSQDLVAGIGNIYRAEILFKAGVHPEQPAHTCTRDQFDALWRHSVELLQRGFVSGSILTVDPDEAQRLGKPWTRRYIYNQRQCGRCKGVVRSWDMAGRTVYCCETCQPLVDQPEVMQTPEPARSTKAVVGKRGRKRSEQEEGAASAAGPSMPGSSVLSPARAKAMAKATPAQVFRSHCAPDDDDDKHAGGPAGDLSRATQVNTPVSLMPDKLTVAQLKAQLKDLCMSTLGKKAELVARLTAALAVSAATPPNTPPASSAPQQQTQAPGLHAAPVHRTAQGDDVSSSSEDKLDAAEAVLAHNLGVPPAPPAVRPGTQNLVHQMASAKEAALEKLAAGESRAVEHVALFDDDVAALVARNNSRTQ